MGGDVDKPRNTTGHYCVDTAKLVEERNKWAEERRALMDSDPDIRGKLLLLF